MLFYVNIYCVQFHKKVYINWSLLKKKIAHAYE